MCCERENGDEKEKFELGKSILIVYMYSKFLLFGAADVMSTFTSQILDEAWKGSPQMMEKKVGNLFLTHAQNHLCWKRLQYHFSGKISDGETSSSAVKENFSRLNSPLNLVSFHVGSYTSEPTHFNEKLDLITVSIHPPFPLNLFFDSATIQSYSSVFRLLSLVKYTDYNLQKIWLLFCSHFKQQDYSPIISYSVCIDVLHFSCNVSSAVILFHISSSSDTLKLPVLIPSSKAKNTATSGYYSPTLSLSSSPEEFDDSIHFEKIFLQIRNLRQEMKFVFIALHEYLMHEAIEATWIKLSQELSQAASFLDMIEFHRVYIQKLYRKCFFGSRLRTVHTIILKILHQIHFLHQLLEDLPVLQYPPSNTLKYEREQAHYIELIQSQTLLKIHHKFLRNRRKLSTLVRRLEHMELFQALSLRLDFNGYYLRYDKEQPQ
ncbi:hypothetical protein IE077_000274 [Cardiosporidium cionae]|uniref:Spindle pole body component n=1 Tax=Cardiosporidium cionae TaxID=476202 RepID=A0ABQ7JBV9_9APIC|nr:hypothetical protein IE077_000274 [Cardiosporidium cionae]|eukprot:KAF8821482.1 hypothetical protein IE077_000274 [Cardiosporidium cionae]